MIIIEFPIRFVTPLMGHAGRCLPVDDLAELIASISAGAEYRGQWVMGISEDQRAVLTEMAHREMDRIDYSYGQNTDYYMWEWITSALWTECAE